MYRYTTGNLYRITTCFGTGFIVEVDEDENEKQSLADCCAELELQGYHITSVTRIFSCSRETPRISVLSSKEYKLALKKKDAHKALEERLQSLNSIKNIKYVFNSRFLPWETVSDILDVWGREELGEEYSLFIRATGQEKFAFTVGGKGNKAELVNKLTALSEKYGNSEYFAHVEYGNLLVFGATALGIMNEVFSVICSGFKAAHSITSSEGVLFLSALQPAEETDTTKLPF